MVLSLEYEKVDKKESSTGCIVREVLSSILVLKILMLVVDCALQWRVWYDD